MAKKKLKMTKKCIAARRRYRAKKAGVPARRKRRGAGGWGGLYKQLKKGQPSKPRRKPRMTPFGSENRILTSLNSGVGAGFRKKRKRGRKGRGRGRGRGRGASKRGPEGAGFWDDLGHTMTTIGQTALSILPMIL